MLVTLVGMPGSGKSTVGRHVAKRLQVDFVDADTAIEQRLGESIRTFFEREGEAAFRDIEEQVVAELVGSHHGVIATGGGAVLRAANREALRSRSTVVYLRSHPEDLFRRLRRDTQRPLLQVGDPLARLRSLHAERDPLYRDTAHFTVETGRPSVAALVNMIVMQLELADVTSNRGEDRQGIRHHDDDGASRSDGGDRNDSDPDPHFNPVSVPVPDRDPDTDTDPGYDHDHGPDPESTGPIGPVEPTR